DVLERCPVQELLGKFNWAPAYPGAVALSAHQAAAQALGSTVEVLTTKPTRDRPYSVPKAVQACAKRALAQPMPGGADQLSIATARQLASGAPVTLAKVRQIARMHSSGGEDPRSLLWGGNAG